MVAGKEGELNWHTQQLCAYHPPELNVDELIESGCDCRAVNRADIKSQETNSKAWRLCIIRWKTCTCACRSQTRTVYAGVLEGETQVTVCTPTTSTIMWRNKARTRTMSPKNIDSVWIDNLLHESDRNRISGKSDYGWLDDNIISASQKLLAQQFPDIGGLHPGTDEGWTLCSNPQQSLGAGIN